MKKKPQPAGINSNTTRLKKAEARAQLAETRTEEAKSRTELAETRTEHAESRTESARTRTEQAEVRTEQAETRADRAETALQKVSPHPIKTLLLNGGTDQKSLLEQLTIRQREILQLVAEGQNTKQIAAILKVSPKTVEYHRMKLMNSLNIHDVPGLVRFAMRTGLIPPGA